MHPLIARLFLDPRHRYARYRAAIVLYAMVVMIGSIPGARVEVGFLAPGLVLHAVTYAVLALLLFTGSEGNALQRAAKTVLTIMAMGAMDEFVQGFFSYRSSSAADWLVDCAAGVLVSALLWRFFSRQEAGAGKADS